MAALAPALTIETTRISPVVRAAPARRPIRDDIPVARRSTPAPRRSGAGFGLFIACVVVCGGSVGAVLFGPQLLARLNPPVLEGIEGFRERPDADGRLLGHFPYSEAIGSSLIVVQPGIELHADAADAFEAMRQAAASDGVDLRLLSGYRSINLQEEIFFEVASERNQTAEERARVSAPPGYSEHSTGYAVDLGDGEAPETYLSPDFEQTRAFRWLQDHAPRYHFILSFPVGNPQGVNHEPWHWRYEGTAAALRLFEPARRLAQRSS